MAEMNAERPALIRESFIEGVLDRLREKKPVRRALPLWGRIHVDRGLPFLFVYRKPLERSDAGTDTLVLGEASYLLASSDPRLRNGLTALIQGIVDVILPDFGAFLLVEVWSSREAPIEAERPGLRRPAFRLWHSGARALFPTVEAFERSLRSIRTRGGKPEVEALIDRDAGPVGLGSCLAGPGRAKRGVHLLGVEVRPFYRPANGPEVFPVALRELRRAFSKSTKHALVDFVRRRTSASPAHYQMLGRRTVVKAVWEADRILAEITDRIDFLLAVTPINLQAAWTSFERNGCTELPSFRYRPLLIAPLELKRELYSAPIKRVEDPELGWMLRKKQRELDWQLTALAARDSQEFLYASLLVFGDVDEPLLQEAYRLLERVPAGAEADQEGHKLTASEFAARARQEIEFFKSQHDQARAGIEINASINGLVVSNGTLLIGADLHVPAARLEALIQHEVGTHLLTFINGHAQPFRLLRSGLAGYDELQEGLAVLSEYLAGGLSPARLRLLAARVVAVKCLTGGADFIQTFDRLHKDFGFSKRIAFGITTRVYRSGGLTKDASYLRGLVRILRHLSGWGSLEPMLVGKIGFEDVSVMEELLRRKVLRPPSLHPRYLQDPASMGRLQAAKSNADVADLLLEELPPRREQ